MHTPNCISSGSYNLDGGNYNPYSGNYTIDSGNYKATTGIDQTLISLSPISPDHGSRYVSSLPAWLCCHPSLITSAAATKISALDSSLKNLICRLTDRTSSGKTFTFAVGEARTYEQVVTLWHGSKMRKRRLDKHLESSKMSRVGSLKRIELAVEHLFSTEQEAVVFSCSKI